MKCPNCGAAVEFTRKTCRRCGIDSLEWLERRAWAGLPRPRKRRGRGKRPLPRWAAPLIALGALLMAAGAIVLSLAPGSPGAFNDAEAKVAFVAPEGWTLETGLGDGWRFHSVARLARGESAIDVEIPLPGLPAAGVESHLADLIRDEFKGRRAVITASEDVMVDGAPGKFVAYEVSPAGGVAAGRGEAMFVGGRGRHYWIRFYTDAASFGRRRPQWRGFVDSLRLARGF